MAEESNISFKLKEYLTRKLSDCKKELIRLKRKRKRIKILYISTVVTSISISAVVTSLASMVAIPIIAIAVLSASSGILTGISAKFNFQNKKVEIDNLIKRANKIQSKLDFVISSNGNLTQKEYQEIWMNLTFKNFLSSLLHYQQYITANNLDPDFVLQPLQ